MNNQKDTQKHGLNSYGQNKVPDVKMFTNKHLYEFANKKTEKIVTALYMVTDCMESDDALKNKLRFLGVELVSDMYKFSSLSPVDIRVEIPVFIARISEIISFVEIANTIGFISEMNTVILKKEFMVLVRELESHMTKDKHFTFTLEEEMFSVTGPSLENRGINNEKDIKDKRTPYSAMSFINDNQHTSEILHKKANGHSFSTEERNSRVDKILKIIKDKEHSIKDISTSFTNCSEKTIQRELNNLLLKGQIKKTGTKRWSRYQAISK